MVKTNTEWSQVEEAMRNPDELTSARLIPEASQRMWTSAKQLRGREFCSILNACVREDWKEAAVPLTAVTRGINQLCVTVPPKPPFPPGDVCYRGGGFDDRYRSFFAQGRKFRQPAYLATSFLESKARDFIARVPAQYPKMLWRVRIDPERKCNHVNLVTKTNVEGEEEYLFAPYSVFTVRSVSWNAGTVAEPHEIELLAAVDNKGQPLDLPLAPWS